MKFKVGDRVNCIKYKYACVVNPCWVSELCLSGFYVIDNCNKRWYLRNEDLEFADQEDIDKDNCSSLPPCYGVGPLEHITKILGETALEHRDKFFEKFVTNEQGGQNSKIEGRYDLLPPFAIKELAKVYEEGAKKYEADNWKKVDVEDHINHALAHVFQYLKYNRRFDMNQAKKYPEEIKIEELSHAFCRLSMALELLLRKT